VRSSKEQTSDPKEIAKTSDFVEPLTLSKLSVKGTRWKIRSQLTDGEQTLDL